MLYPIKSMDKLTQFGIWDVKAGFRLTIRHNKYTGLHCPRGSSKYQCMQRCFSLNTDPR